MKRFLEWEDLDIHNERFTHVEWFISKEGGRTILTKVDQATGDVEVYQVPMFIEDLMRRVKTSARMDAQSDIRKAMGLE